jgi:hypothetical protein
LPTITAQPVNQFGCVGGGATFNVTAVTAPNAGGPLAYQWQAWNGSAWVNICRSYHIIIGILKSYIGNEYE